MNTLRKTGRITLSATLALALTACGGASAPPFTGGTPTPTPTTGTCALLEQQNFARAVIDEWYLFPSLVDTSAQASSFASVQAYLDALVAPARAQNRDRGFTFATSIQEENDLINSGSSAGFGIRLGYDTGANRVFVIEAYENAPAFQQGFDRGTELLAIGTNSSNLQLVSSLMASGGPQAVSNALGPSDPGVTRVIRYRTAAGVENEVSVAKQDYALDPVSDRYGVVVINDGGKKVGYLNLRTFIVGNADDQLRAAFQRFGSEGITELIIDFRYNGGGLVRIADLMGDLMGKNKVGQVWSRTVLRDSKSSENSTELFETEANAITPTKVAFIGRGGTASASELVINSMIPYLGNNIALIGTDTFGKPVGQFGFDFTDCDLRVRAVTFQTNNANNQGGYYSGLASVMPNTCQANDDIFRQFGDPAEASIATALDFLAGRSCTPISSSGNANVALAPTAPSSSGGGNGTGNGEAISAYQSFNADGRPIINSQILQPAQPNAVQHRIPGLF